MAAANNATLVEAATNLYMAGRWQLVGMATDTTTPDTQALMWANLRDALGMEPGAKAEAGRNR